MTAAYLVTERERDVALLKKLLPSALAQSIVFYATKGRSSVYSAAGTLLSDRSRPVVIVLDAETDNPSEIQEKISLANTLLLPAAPAGGVPFKVFLVAPTIEDVLLKSPTLQEVKDNTEWSEVVDHLTPEQIQTLQQHALVQQLSEFLSSVASKAAST